MSFVQLRIELPSYSYSFQIPVYQHSTIRDVKQNIFMRCPGGPRVEGQRLVWRGRFLADSEKLEDIIASESPDTLPTFHLSVHPSAWMSSPPNSRPPVVQNAPSPQARPIVTPPVHGFPGPQTPSHMTPQHPSFFPPPPTAQHAPPLTFIAYTHNNALTALTETNTAISSPGPELESAKAYAKSVLERYGYAWPEIFDAPYPPVGDEPEGVKYERVTMHGRDYLSLITPDATPTPLQEHCLKLLTHTFPLLAIPSAYAVPYGYPPTPSAHPEHVALPPHVNPYLPQNINARLQALGFAPIRVAQQAPAAAEVRAIPVRALVAPLFLLTLRTMFLLYFFSPFQKPVFGLIVGAWLLYETWNTIRNAIGDPAGRNRDRVAQDAGNGNGNPNGNGDGDGNGNGNANGQGAAGQPAPDGVDNAQAPRARRGPVLAPASGIPQTSGHDAILETLARFNTSEEWNALAGHPASSDHLTSTTHKVFSFFALSVLTVHPAFWNRRRSMLRRREGHVRTEANQRQWRAEEGATGVGVERRELLRVALTVQHERRPGWVREYIERVLRGEWVDE